MAVMEASIRLAVGISDRVSNAVECIMKPFLNQLQLLAAATPSSPSELNHYTTAVGTLTLVA